MAVAAGVALRIWQFLAGRSVHMDEAALLSGIRQLPWPDLARPLPYAQTAPIGWLALEKGIIALAGTSPAVLRTLPLLCGIAAVALFPPVAFRRLSPKAAVFGVGLFSLAGPLVLYSAFMKPYSADVLASVLVLYAVEALEPLPLAVLGLSLPWFSDAAVILLSAAGLWLLLIRGRKALPIVGAWAVGVIPAAALALSFHASASGAYMRDFWTAGFMPWNRQLLWWPLERTAVIGYGVIGIPWVGLVVGLPLAVRGGAVLWQREKPFFTLLAIILTVVVFMSLVHIYPLGGFYGVQGGRTVLWLAPILALWLAAGLEGVDRLFLWVPLALLAASLTVLWKNVPYRLEEIRPALDYLQAHERRDDYVYVYYGSRYPFEYYRQQYNFRGVHVVLGRCHRRDPEAYLSEIGELAGEPRVWVLMSHDFGGEMRHLESSLDAAGHRLGARHYPGAALLLYDLRGWNRASAGSWIAPSMRWSVDCSGVWNVK